MNTRRCEYPKCQVRLGARHAHNARFCSGRCRTADCRRRQRQSDPLPAQMKRRRQWVRYTQRNTRKVPLMSADKRRAASSTDAATWSTYSAACRSSAGVGKGFVLTADDPIVCIDLDHALVGGVLAPWAREIVDQVPDTYIEVSPSGAGLHLWGTGTVGRGRRIRSGARSIEVYDRGRYITVTAQPFENAPSKLADLSKVIATLV